MSGILDFGFSNIDLWRSEEMHLVQLMIPSESAHDTVAALGDLGLLQFKDLNNEKSAFQRTYANQVKRCDELARKLRFLGEQVQKGGLTGAPPVIDARPITVDELESKLEDVEKEVLELNGNNDRLARTYHELVEMQTLLDQGGKFFAQTRAEVALDSGAGTEAETMDHGAPLLETAMPHDAQKASKLGFVAGLIPQDKLLSFERLLFRATRGNMFLRKADVGMVADPASGELTNKSVFIVFFAGERARAKINKISEAFGASRYPFPEEPARQRQMLEEVSSRIVELSTTLAVGDRHRRGVLQTVADHMSSWTGLVRQEKGIYHTLNKLSVDVTHRVLIGEAWVPASARQQVQEVLRITAQQSSTQVSAVLQRLTTHDPPPTYFKTNKFTECFQNIVDAYGVARYREVNPAVYTIMTFPFLFAVMFGDLGHGVLMLLFALLFVLSEKSMQGQELSDMVAMVFGGRYCILLMSFFSMYVGFLYNEFFSIPMAWWGGATHFACSVPVDDIRDCLLKGGHVMFPPGSDPYPFGIDPIWHGTKTELPFLNSLKMKMSILIGVVHMNLGILMSLYNNVYFRDTLSTLCEFIPQIIFLNGLFGYLSFLIVFKWVTGSLADLYHVMIYMFLNPGVLPPTDPGYLFPGQGNVQLFLLLVSLITVPIMLLPKPLILNARNKAHKQALRGAEYHVSGDDEENITGDDHSGGGHGGHGGQFDFSEVLVHQMIHTIEFVLGAVSNTASYLRLWALSLAHSQLSAVFYDRVLMAALKSGSPVAMFVGFFVFACSSFGVLMVMESLSAFLHALRLHWVEFQNKFYRGDGYAFTPFSTKFVELEASA